MVKLLLVISKQITPLRVEIITQIPPVRAKIHRIARGITFRIVIRDIPKWLFEGDNTQFKMELQIIIRLFTYMNGML